MDKISISHIGKELKNLDSSKAVQESDIPTKKNTRDSINNKIRNNIDVFAFVLYQGFHKSIETDKFPDVTPLFRKEDRTMKDNYRPISILPNLSKVLQRCIYNKLCNNDQIISNIIYKNRKNF